QFVANATIRHQPSAVGLVMEPANRGGDGHRFVEPVGLGKRAREPDRLRVHQVLHAMFFRFAKEPFHLGDDPFVFLWRKLPPLREPLEPNQEMVSSISCRSEFARSQPYSYVVTLLGPSRDF